MEIGFIDLWNFGASANIFITFSTIVSFWVFLLSWAVPFINLQEIHVEIQLSEAVATFVLLEAIANSKGFKCFFSLNFYIF